MKRSVRNGIAIAGMAGGMWLLGHAVANAGTTDQSATAGNTTSATSTSSGGSSSNSSTNVAKAENSNSTSVTTGTISGGNGGTNTATINTGVSPGGGPAPSAVSSSTSPSGGGGGGGTSATVHTGSVSVSQQANGGSVSNSGNVKVDTSVTQSASASNKVSQSSSSSSSKSDGHKSDGQDSSASNSLAPMDGGPGGHGGGNDSANIAVAHNDNSTTVSTGDIYGGNGGSNSADINTGAIIEPVFDTVTPLDSQSDGHKHHGNIDVMVSTGAVWVRQEANGGDVSGSGNVDVNGNVHQSASASNDVTQTSTSADHRHHHHGGNDAFNIAVAHNDNSTDVSTGDIYGGNGGDNSLAVNTGLIFGFVPVWQENAPLSTTDSTYGKYDHKHHRSIDVTISTGDVSASQEANGGSVSNSGNVVVCTSADQSASASNDVTQSSTSKGHKGHGNDAFNKAIAHNDNSTEVSTGDIYGGNGGSNYAEINTGAVVFFGPFGLSSDSMGRDHHKASVDVSISTGDVWASQEANGGSVSKSGNVSVSSSADQSASASNDVTQSSTSKGHKGHGNDTFNKAIARNDNSTDVSTGDIYGGNGGENYADINTGLITGGFIGGGLPSKLDITTGDVSLSQEANGGSVSNSGNVAVGQPCVCEKKVAPVTPTPTPTPTPSPTPAAPVKTVVKTVTVLSSAQPTSTLAVTGADTSAPLTAGLLALGAGAALTLAGRRRREAQNG